MTSRRLRSRFVDNPNSIGAKRRARRWAWLAETFPDLDQMSVIDLGGSVESWLRAEVRPKHVHVVNLEDQPKDPPDWMAVDYADACELPAAIRSRRYDLAFSNSVIEHVGGHHRRVLFADAVRALADAYWVQTPYRYFPIEPHWVAPGGQYLPVALRAQLVRRWPLIHSRPKTREEAMRVVFGTELIDRTQMRSYFPDAVIRNERLAGLTKSIIAIRKPR